MNRPQRQNLQPEARNMFGGSQLLLTIISLSALFATFWLANSETGFERKILIFSAVVCCYLLFCAAIYFWQKNQAKISEIDFENFDEESQPQIFNREVENRLFALEEANQFFGASLKPQDMFRLVASRVGELLPYAVCLLYLPVENKNTLKVAFAEGEQFQFFQNLEIDKNEGLAGRSFQTGKIQFDENLMTEKTILPENAWRNLHSAAAVPLAGKGEIFGVLEIFVARKKSFDANDAVLLEAIGERIAPLFASSMTFAQNLSNALTDALTGLPNERAFFLVLENQIAESTRFPQERPLTVLTIDLKNFTALNQKYGHTNGDRILSFAGEIIKRQLRQMDFLARYTGDEFLAVLPTASEKVAREVVARIERDFALRRFNISDDENIPVELNFGSATFGKDGETAQRLLAAALLRKQQEKSVEPSKVLFFPKEFVN